METTSTQWVLATENKHKAEEFAELLTKFPIQLKGLDRDFALPPETGNTLMANAQIKARAAAKASGSIALADDSGLEVDALGGKPGVHSSRFAGEDASFEDNVKKLLAELAGIHGVNRRARFRCVLVLAAPDGRELSAEGRVEGFIIETPRGSGGFGYDPVFVPEGRDRTLAELAADEKNALSHRALAVKNLKENLERLERWEP